MSIQATKIQLVLWDNYFQDELMQEIEHRERFDPAESICWKDAMDTVCRRHFPLAEDFKIVISPNAK